MKLAGDSTGPRWWLLEEYDEIQWGDESAITELEPSWDPAVGEWMAPGVLGGLRVQPCGLPIAIAISAQADRPRARSGPDGNGVGDPPMRLAGTSSGWVYWLLDPDDRIQAGDEFYIDPFWCVVQESHIGFRAGAWPRVQFRRDLTDLEVVACEGHSGITLDEGS